MQQNGFAVKMRTHFEWNSVMHEIRMGFDIVDCFFFIAAITRWHFMAFTKIPNQYQPLHDIAID